jgi:hypothetical protein
MIKTLMKVIRKIVIWGVIIQKLAGMMAALSRFISKLGERGMPFYKLLCKADEFQ